METKNDKRIVLTLDAGGTNFRFSAIQGNEQIVDEIRLDSNADNLDKSLANIVEGFTRVQEKLNDAPLAISFAFPGPADYPNGILGDLGNLKGYRGGVALGPMLQEKFGLPVFINNDGDLYAYGEAIAGFLPEINKKLADAGNPKQYKNLFGLTLGTGFGGGIVSNGVLFGGDNSMAGEIWLLRNKLSPLENVEEHASIRGVQRVYAQKVGIKREDAPSPKEIFEIGTGKIKGNKEAAVEAFKQMAQVVGDAISNAITLLDGLVVIGGGLAGASSLFMPFLIEEMNSNFVKQDGTKFRRLVAQVFNLEDENDTKKFAASEAREINVYGTNKKVTYDPSQRIGVGISKIGTSKAISIGAYAFALHKLDAK
jgi:glucokinase